MSTLNADASARARAARAHAVTDVTGFGLLGHLHELAAASGVAAEVHAGAVPAIAGALALLEDADAVSGGSRRNREWAESFATYDADVPEAQRRLVCDAMTSGGLLVALPAGAGGGAGGAGRRPPGRRRAGRDPGAALGHSSSLLGRDAGAKPCWARRTPRT